MENRVKPKRLTVEFDGEEYAVRGMPDTAALNIELLEEPKKKSMAAVFNRHLSDNGVEGAPIDWKNDVSQILMVCRYVEPPIINPEEVAKGAEPVYDRPMSETEIAVLSREHGALFALLYAKAFQIFLNLNDAGKNEDEASVIAEIGLGNWIAAALSGGSSSSAASPQPESTPTPTSGNT